MSAIAIARTARDRGTHRLMRLGKTLGGGYEAVLIARRSGERYRTGAAWCTCPSFRFRGTCKHSVWLAGELTRRGLAPQRKGQAMNNELVRAGDGLRLPARRAAVLTPEQVDVLRSTIARGCSDEELALFLAVAERTGLDPFQRQIHAIKQQGKPLIVHVGIDGHRLIAERSGKWRGSLGPYWCGPDGAWVDVWLAQAPPAAARFGVVKLGFAEPVWGVAVLTVCRNQNAPIWQKDPAGMLAKCAESLAIRRAFPAELYGTQPSRELVGAAWVDEETGEVLEEAPARQAEAPARAYQLPPAQPESAARAESSPRQEPPARVEVAVRQGERSDYAGATVRAPSPPLVEPDPALLAPEYPGAQAAQCGECGRGLTKGMWAMSHRSHGRPLCPDHQRELPTVAERVPPSGAEEADPFLGSEAGAEEPEG